MRVLPKSLAGQLVVLLLVALVAAQLVGLVIFASGQAEAVRRANQFGLLESMASTMRVLQIAAPGVRGDLAAAAGSRRIRFWTSAEAAAPPAASAFAAMALNAQFERMFTGPLREPPRLALIDQEGRPVVRERRPRWRDRARQEERPGIFRSGPERYDLVASVPFRDGGWLNAETRISREAMPLAWPLILSTLLMAVAILAAVWFVAGRVTRPLRALADAASAFGRGAQTGPLPEQGPDEVRRLTAAFNRMQDRLGRFIADRTRMVAAIGHDLRTPITSLRLRAELLDDKEAAARIVATLDEMQHMSEATLAFARDDAAREPARPVDLSAMLSSLADDLAEAGKPVIFAEADRLVYQCRPAALKRAFDNLIQNAVQYGGSARIALADTQAGPVVTIDDDGPGIPAGKLDDAFEPFVRLETSRSRETGGAGLGLSIARSIVLEHGGELVLANRPEGGLRAQVRLPAADRS